MQLPHKDGKYLIYLYKIKEGKKIFYQRNHKLQFL